MALARLELLKSKNYLKMTDGTLDSELKALLLEATARVEQETGRVLESTTHTDERHTGRDTNELYPHQWPVTALGSVYIWNTTSETFVSESTAYFDVITPPGDRSYIYYPKLGQDDNSEYTEYPTTPNGIKITYTAGYVTTAWATAEITASFDVPADLERATAMLAMLAWLEGKGAGQARMGMKRTVIGEQQIIVDRPASGLVAEVEAILSCYRRASL